MPKPGRNWIKEAEILLNTRYAQVCATLDKMPTSFLKIQPALDEEEAQYFLQGLETGLFAIDDEGYIQSKLLPPVSGKNDRQKILQLFWRTAGGRNLFREGVCQLATISSLILKYGWQSDHIIMEPGIEEFKGLAYGVDILIRDPKRNIVICGEVKRNNAEFKKLIDGFRHCCQRGPHPKDECEFSKNHPKYEFCSSIKPSYFLAIAPGQAISFKLSYNKHPFIENEKSELIYSSEH